MKAFHKIFKTGQKLEPTDEMLMLIKVLEALERLVKSGSIEKL